MLALYLFCVSPPRVVSATVPTPALQSHSAKTAIRRNDTSAATQRRLERPAGAEEDMTLDSKHHNAHHQDGAGRIATQADRYATCSPEIQDHAPRQKKPPRARGRRRDSSSDPNRPSACHRKEVDQAGCLTKKSTIQCEKTAAPLHTADGSESRRATSAKRRASTATGRARRSPATGLVA